MGKVYLIGAGPGAADLITLRGARLLAQADVVFHDALVQPELLALAPQAQLVAVGKRCRQLSTDQRFINRALVEAAQRHAVVVRLKGGDAMLFGRAQEEIAALRDAGIEYEIVPGVTSALAAAASLSLTRGVTKTTLRLMPRWVSDRPRSAAAAKAEVTPGTISYSMPASRSAVISSCARPNSMASPPLSRATIA